MHSRVREDVRAVDPTGLAAQVADADVVARTATPLGQQAAEGREVRIVIGRLADQDVAAVAGAERVLAGAADEDVAAGPAEELVATGPADQDVVGGAAAGVEIIVAVA